MTFGFWLKKAVSFCLMPLQFSLLLALAGLVLLWRGRGGRRAGLWLVTAAAALLALLGNNKVGDWLVRPLEGRYPPALAAGGAPSSALAACRYVVVLGGGNADTPWLPPTEQLSHSARARLVEGLRLLRALPAAQLIVSGAGEPGYPTHAQTLAAAAEALGVPAARISRFDNTHDTEDEAQTIRRRVGAAPFALVTSAWHMPRAMALCRHLGLHPVPCPADFEAKPDPNFRWDDWKWSVEGLERSTVAVHEWLGLAWTHLRGQG